MAAKPETSFYNSVHRFLPPLGQLHREKMANPYRGGTADHWYSGTRADLWIEWKFVVLPKRDSTLVPINLSPLQKDWIRQRHYEGRSVWVIVGCREGGVIMPQCTWDEEWRTDVFRVNLQARQSIAAAITEHCL